MQRNEWPSDLRYRQEKLLERDKEAEDTGDMKVMKLFR